ncbi:hypothetical protein BCU68_09280 [Vibrio sp. 10N.286.49.B3]|uniref:polysaccharide pyruvyl transferase family protein n=1 Tax=Vibrio sp. 10N.286.49.B3 TaxID=1880855 RepID=UPI000CB89AF7|nr:polysaccharide pyruvyl transferase family protein [Vibrio sp. 10N.286.49.B3]PMH45976.1 hypothetical protein BCU68_09280 [Vibrio sp. 10N.286.49.B3]
MKILHIAAFEGNIGDNASHLGFQEILNQIQVNSDVDRLEIRKAYNNYIGEDKIIFNEDFVALANTYDLVIFGGGGFLDYWVDNSVNGTTINITNDLLDTIRCPILITSIGCNPHRKVPEGNHAKFKAFLDYVQTNPNITIALRNDGSVNSIAHDFGQEYLSDIHEILDHGFFYTPSNAVTLPLDESYAVINITNDQLEMKDVISDDPSWYHAELKSIVDTVINKGLKAVFVPHIHQDITAISQFLDYLPSSTVRSSTMVAPCFQGDAATDFIFNLYKNADVVIASRYHSNVCSLKFGVKTIGLSPLHRIEYIHQQLVSSENGSSFYIEKNVANKVNHLITNLDTISINHKKLNMLKEATIQFYASYFANLED